MPHAWLDNQALVAPPRQLRIEEPLALDCGATLPGATVNFETYGTLSARRDNAILLCHSLTRRGPLEVGPLEVGPLEVGTALELGTPGLRQAAEILARQGWVPELNFGHPGPGPAAAADGTETHLDRELDIGFSGDVFSSVCRTPFLDIALPLFDRQPVAGQPGVVVDTGCGDRTMWPRCRRPSASRPSGDGRSPGTRCWGRRRPQPGRPPGRGGPAGRGRGAAGDHGR